VAVIGSTCGTFQVALASYRILLKCRSVGVRQMHSFMAQLVGGRGMRQVPSAVSMAGQGINASAQQALCKAHLVGGMPAWQDVGIRLVAVVVG
jgi:hypothetical protein